GGQQIALATAYEQNRNLECGSGVGQALGSQHRFSGLVIGTEAPGHESWIPMPIPAAVIALAEVLRQTAQVGGTFTVWVERRDRVGGVFERRESFEVRPEELADPVPTHLLHPVGDVDQHESG